MLSTFLFDLDGTLLDSVDLILRSYKYMLKQHRGYEGSDESRRTMYGGGTGPSTVHDYSGRSRATAAGTPSGR